MAMRSKHKRNPRLAQLIRTAQLLQNKNASEGIEVARKAQTLSEKEDDHESLVESLSYLSWYQIMLSDYDTALATSQEALNLITNSSQLRHRRESKTIQLLAAQCRHNIGTANLSKGNYKEAISFLEQAIEIRRLCKKDLAAAASLNNLGIVYFNLGEYSHALRVGNEALELRERQKDEAGVSNSLTNIGGIFHRLGDYPKALEYYSKSLTINQKLQFRNLEATTKQNIGILNFEQGEYDKATRYFSDALQLAQELHDQLREAGILINLGRVSMQKYQTNEANSHFKSSLLLSEAIGYKQGIAIAKYHLAEVQYSIGEFSESKRLLEEAIVDSKELRERQIQVDCEWLFGQISASHNFTEHNIEIAEQYLLTSLKLAEESGFNDKALRAHHELSELYESKNHLEQSIYHLKLAHRIERELFNDAKDRRIQQLQIVFEIEHLKQEKEIHELQAATLQEELNRKSKELTTLSIHLLQKNELLSELKSKLTLNQSQSGKSKQTHLNELLSIVESGATSEKDWKQFEKQFLELNPNFLSKLSQAYPTLTPQELKTCMLLKLGFSSKQISAFFYTTVRNAETLRYRVRKKMNLKAEVNLTTFLSSF